MDDFLASIKIFAGNFAPRGWAFCNGQLLSIAQNTALFSLLGTTYGGDGRTTFALPDLRGRAPIHFGQGPGLSDYSLGQTGGQETVTLLSSEMPVHTHSLSVSNTNGTSHVPLTVSSVAAPVDVNGDSVNGFSNNQPNMVLSPTTIGNTGGSQAHENRPPYIALNYIIALQGIFPSRS
jgi:microcystin-dependent protein